MDNDNDNSKPFLTKFRMSVKQNPKNPDEQDIKVWLDDKPVTNCKAVRVVAPEPGATVRVVLELVPELIEVEGNIDLDQE